MLFGLIVVALLLSVASNVILWMDYRAMAERWKERMDEERREKDNG